jgi:hypothetical protein
VPAPPTVTLHTDASKFGFGGTLGFDLKAGGAEELNGQGKWETDERLSPMQLLELRVLRLISAHRFAMWLRGRGIRHILGWCDNHAAVHIVNSMMSATPALMPALRLFKRELDLLGVSISLAWLPSALNYYAYLLSRSWDPGDVQCTQEVLRSLAMSLGLADGDAAFAYRPLQESPVFLRRQTWQDLQWPCTYGRARLYNPPMDLTTLTLAKIQRKNASEVVILPHWPGSPWMASLKKIATSWIVAKAEMARNIWAADKRRMKEQWEMVVATVNMPAPDWALPPPPSPVSCLVQATLGPLLPSLPLAAPFLAPVRPTRPR